MKRLKGDASDRTYYRIKASGNTSARSMIIMDKGAPFEQESDDFLLIRDFLETSNIPVPAFYFSSPANGKIYLEDCGDLLFETVVRQADSKTVKKHYKKALDFLLEMQVEGKRHLGKDNPASGRFFDTEKFMAELAHTLKWFVKEHKGEKLSGADEKKLMGIFNRLVAPIEKEKRFFSHRDYHSRNIMIKGRSYYILDFQDARMGPPQYDLASLLFDSYVKLPESMRSDLLRYYINKLENRLSIRIKKDYFMDVFFRTALQRNLKALGTFGFQAAKKKNRFYLKYVPDTIEYVRINLKEVGWLKSESDWLLSLLT